MLLMIFFIYVISFNAFNVLNVLFKGTYKKIKAETTINRHKFSYSAKTETTQNTCTYFSVIHYRTVKCPCFFLQANNICQLAITQENEQHVKQ